MNHKVSVFLLTAILLLIAAVRLRFLPLPVICLVGGAGMFFGLSALAGPLFGGAEARQKAVPQILMSFMVVFSGTMILMLESEQLGIDMHFAARLLIGEAFLFTGGGIWLSRGWKPPEVLLGERLGFRAASGAIQRTGIGMTGVFSGLRVTLSVYYGGLDFGCRVADTRALLYVYREGTFDVGRLFSPPPVVEGLPGWDGYTVRAGNAGGVLPAFSAAATRPDRVFSESCGFNSASLDDGDLNCRFRAAGLPDPVLAGRMLEGFLFLAARLNV